MTSRHPRGSGFTLFEVLAAVAVLALTFTILAEAAIVGLRSEGIDRRRAEASLIADRELVTLLSALETGAPAENGVRLTEEAPYRIAVELASEDLLTLLPSDLVREIESESEDLATLLVDERGESRIRRVSVVVEWDEVGEEAERVVRLSHHLDATGLEALLPPGGGEEGEAPDEEESDEDDTAAALEELDQLLLESGGTP